MYNRYNRDVQLSKSLSWLLRHGAVKEKILISSEGYIKVDDILQHKSLRGKYSIDDIKRVVANNDKQRFKLRINTETEVLEIKANQGHSIPISNVELKLILQLTYKLVIHGTYLNCWPQIKLQGLHRMKRQHIHLAKADFNTPVISGLRKNAEVHIYIDLPKALNDGLVFYESENGVILTPGNDKGFLEPKYFSKVLKVNTGKC